MRVAIQLGVLVLAAVCLTACSETKGSANAAAGCVASPNAPGSCAGFSPPPPIRPGITSLPAPPPLDANEPQCFGALYAGEKRDYMQRQQVDRAPLRRPQATHLNGVAPPSPRIQIQPANLGTPPEIQRIERGYVTNWVGGFINDGNMSWNGIDLDRHEVISVVRRVYDTRAIQTRPFGDPVFTDWDHSSFARKWSDDQRIEMEVVTLRNLRPEEIQAFVCIANGAWGAPQKSPLELLLARPSDTQIDNAILLDRTEENGAVISYMRRAQPRDSLGWAAEHIFRAYNAGFEWR